MGRIVPLLMLVALAGTASCRKQPEGAVKVVVIGATPALRDPLDGPLSAPDQLLVANVAQGLVRFDAGGNVVAGLAERWTVTDDGLSYIFRLAATNWPDGTKLTAQQVARLLKREIGGRSRNSLKDAFGAVEDIVAMTDRVIEINLTSPRPDLLSLLAQPQMAIVRNGQGTGPFAGVRGKDGAIKLSRQTFSPEDETTSREQLLLAGAQAPAAVQAFAAENLDLVLGGTFADLAYAQRVKLPRDSLRFDPASGLFGLVPRQAGGPLDKPEIRQLLSEAIDRDTFVTATGVTGLASRATLLESALDGTPTPIAPAWTATPYANRLAGLQAQANRLFGKAAKPTVRIALPDGPGADFLLQLLQRDWGQLGLKVELAENPEAADLTLIDEVAPSSSPSWFVRHFRCDRVAVCDPKADELMDGARQSPVPAQRYALLGQAAALIDRGQLFLPIAAPVRWSLVSARIQNFAGNRYARHTLTDLEARAPTGG
ncbi:MAG TPA: ABC transporter substrate-binding protein [Sphingomicrobium sp.]|nr:ABC transporter substrate-binding protein [Sphingomicrobium sp.]